MTVNVKQAPRRPLRFDSLGPIVADAEAVTAGPHRTTGNWTAAQIIHHVAFAIEMGNRGVEIPIPLPMRLFGRTLRLLGLHLRPIKPGINPPGEVARAFAPPADVRLDEALQKLRDEVAYAEAHGMTKPSPLFGRLSPQEWVTATCRHAELHLSFIHPEEADGGEASV